jgi:hypothetical protein
MQRPTHEVPKSACVGHFRYHMFTRKSMTRRGLSIRAQERCCKSLHFNGTTVSPVDLTRLAAAVRKRTAAYMLSMAL